jgi:chromosome segregation ATPase
MNGHSCIAHIEMLCLACENELKARAEAAEERADDAEGRLMLAEQSISATRTELGECDEAYVDDAVRILKARAESAEALLREAREVLKALLFSVDDGRGIGEASSAADALLAKLAAREGTP